MDINQFISQTDFKLLRKQKTSVTDAIVALTAIGGKDQYEICRHLDGLLHFLDAFQDMAVDTYGKSEVEVFNIKETGI